MNSTPETSNPPLTAPSPDLAQLARALGSLPRWQMLKELSCGEARSVTELAAVAGCSYQSAVKHLAVLHATGLALRGRGKLYQIPKQFFPTPGQPVVDYGHCQLRLDKAG
jgi:predicted transcriptional regulator